MKKKNNVAISNLLTYITKKRHRAVLLINGPNCRDQIPFIHYLWSKNSTQNRSNILWCYKKKKKVDRKNTTSNNSTVYSGQKKKEKFFDSTTIRYCFYHETKKIVGNTYGLCILEDFESITPNSLARLVETVDGGGIIVFLLEVSETISNFHNISMTIYKKYKTQNFSSIAGRFLDRFFFSLTECKTFLHLDDELSILPFTNLKFLDASFSLENFQEMTNNLLIELIKNIGPMEPISCLLSKTKTFDQARAFLSFTEAISDKKKWSTIFLTSNRGRGKSATLGLATASSIAYGYGYVAITAPDPENLHSFFAFLFIGLKSLGYVENQDYEILYNNRLKYIDSIHVYSSHRQTIKFLFPSELQTHKNRIELLIIDEAAGISSTFLEEITGPYVTFVSSTTSGYEGFGKSLTMRIIKTIKFQLSNLKFGIGNSKPRIFREILLDEPIRYSKNDPVEKWLYNFLCLNIEKDSILINGCPITEICQLFLVDRNALFSGQKWANKFLQKIVGLFSSSHYKNSPDDLQMLCDAPSHRIFVLITPVNLSIGLLPDILCTIHVCYEGQINRKFAKNCLLNGIKKKGDLIPWVLSSQYLDPGFAELSGLRIVRIATHPDLQSMGYGTRAIKNLLVFARKKKKNFKYIDQENKKVLFPHSRQVYEHSPQMLVNLESRVPPILDYISVSFGLTLPLVSFWKKNGFLMVLIRPFLGKVCNEHTSVMIKSLSFSKDDFSGWNLAYKAEFLKQFVNFLGLKFEKMSSFLVYNILEISFIGRKKINKRDKFLKKLFSPLDYRRFYFFSTIGSKDFISIFYLFPTISKLYFFRFFPKNLFSTSEAILLISIGLQFKNVETIKSELFFKTENFSTIVNNIMKKVYVSLKAI